MLHSTGGILKTLSEHVALAAVSIGRTMLQTQTQGTKDSDGGGVARLEDAVLREYGHVAHGGLRDAHGNGDYEKRLAMSAAVGADTDLDPDTDTDMTRRTHVQTPSLAHSQVLDTACKVRDLEIALLEAEIAQVALLQVYPRRAGRKGGGYDGVV